MTLVVGTFPRVRLVVLQLAVRNHYPLQVFSALRPPLPFFEDNVGWIAILAVTARHSATVPVVGLAPG